MEYPVEVGVAELKLVEDLPLTQFVKPLMRHVGHSKHLGRHFLDQQKQLYGVLRVCSLLLDQL